MEEEEEKNQEDVSITKRGRTDDLRVLKNSLMWEASNATYDHGKVLACAATKGHVWVCVWGLLLPKAR